MVMASELELYCAPQPRHEGVSDPLRWVGSLGILPAIGVDNVRNIWL